MKLSNPNFNPISGEINNLVNSINKEYRNNADIIPKMSHFWNDIVNELQFKLGEEILSKLENET